jgi:hypothetical protein
MGVFPNAFIDKTKPSIERLAKNYKNYSLDYRMGRDMADKTANQGAFQ